MASLLEQVATVIRRVIGVPDYDAYVQHATRCHPEAAPMSREAFAKDALTRRYNTPGNRCC